MRRDEGYQVENIFKKWGINFLRINVGKRFLSALKGVTEPEEKRKIIGEEFIRVFEKTGKKVRLIILRRERFIPTL